MDISHVPANLRWAIANWPVNSEHGAVTRFCQRHGISRAGFYKIRRLAVEPGPVGDRAGLATRSARSRSRCHTTRDGPFDPVIVRKRQRRLD